MRTLEASADAGAELNPDEPDVEPNPELDPDVEAILAGVEPDPYADEMAEAVAAETAARKEARAEALARLDQPDRLCFAFDAEPAAVAGALVADREARAKLAAYWRSVTVARIIARRLLRLDPADAPIDADLFWEHDDLPAVQAAFARFGLGWPPPRHTFVDRE